MPQSLSFLRDSTKHSKLHSALASSAAEFFTAFLNISAMVQLRAADSATGKVGSGTQVTGYPTNQELGSNLRLLADTLR